MKRATVAAWAIPVIAAIVVLCLWPSTSYNDSDTFWHIENGLYMLEHRVVLHHALHTFYGDSLPYIPHEFGFQLIEAALYKTFGWPGIYLLTAASFGLLIVGLHRLMDISRRELGKPGMPLACWLLLVPVALWVYYVYFTSRPQMMSAFLIVWYVVWLRSYRMTGKLRYGAALTLGSLLIANVHAGVWPVIAVFSGMQIAETLWERNGKLRDIYVYAAAALAGLLNPGGWRSLTYILVATKNDYNRLINEWVPIDFLDWENVPIVLMLLFFAYILPFSHGKKAFRIMMIVGIAYLGTTNIKQNLFLWLFVPYFAAAAVDRAPLIRSLGKLRVAIRPKAVWLGMSAGLLLNAVYVFAKPPEVDAKTYPVDEMTYILERANPGERPKVLARYGSSGYVMFRGGNVLCDGREDPFITDDSVGLYGWNAFERSMYGFSDRLPAIAASDRPDYVLVKSDSSEQLKKQWADAFGTPLYTGRYGSVYVPAP